MNNLFLPIPNKGQIYSNKFLNSIYKIIRTRNILKTFKKSYGKNDNTYQRMHVQNHAYANKSRHMYMCNICQLPNPAGN